MSGTSPRKFAEKIAIMNRKQSEDMSTFDSIMREVRQITSSSETQTISQPSTSLCPPQWNPIGGSLPNVHQMPSYHTEWGATWVPSTQNAHRSRTPEQHPAFYHPYGRGQRSPDRVPPLDPHYVPYPNPQYQLLAPEQWNHACSCMYFESIVARVTQWSKVPCYIHFIVGSIREHFLFIIMFPINQWMDFYMVIMMTRFYPGLKPIVRFL
ncbi:hypothetical protein KIN20_033258 [Parelaphostrongylus tenuis]|uniref:Transducer of regulated CREB activity N-terminal domain-containing protein n=1 Tax=Parelaphostrongylus tenuis TaxID=148309 RepID=A0AAD5R7P5_PARTN|nr:hypothetical protein KIN20_033258 [Parelaphostrongylus tenuis]